MFAYLGTWLLCLERIFFGLPFTRNLIPASHRLAITGLLAAGFCFFLFFTPRIILAQQLVDFTSIDPSECVAPSSYLSCYESAVETTAHCVSETSNDATAQKGCICVDGEEKINCFAEAC